MENNEAKAKEQPADNSGDRFQQEAGSPIDAANKAAERLERANAERKALIEREEKLESNRILGGKSGSAEQVKAKKEMSDEEYAERALKGEIPPKYE